MNNAAERLLGLPQDDVESMAREIIFGQLRLTVASLTIEQINQDRESFLDSIRAQRRARAQQDRPVPDQREHHRHHGRVGLHRQHRQEGRVRGHQPRRVDVAEQDARVRSVKPSGARADHPVAENVAESEKGKKQAEADQRVYVQAAGNAGRDR